jgi:hypothetical protein
VQTLDTFYFLSGLFFTVVFVTLVLVLCTPVHGTDGNNSKLSVILHYLIIFLLIVSIIMGIGDIMYSFYGASQMYGLFDEFQQQGQVNCSSLVYYCLFELVAIVLNHIFVEISLISLLYMY